VQDDATRTGGSKEGLALRRLRVMDEQEKQAHLLTLIATFFGMGSNDYVWVKRQFAEGRTADEIIDALQQAPLATKH
jgi:hypothetical protein